MKQYATLEATVYFWFAANDTSGSGGDGASPAADVRLAGAAVDAIPVLSPTPVLLTHANYPAGCYEVAIAATAANGFVANNTYAVFCTLAIDSQNPTGFIGSVDLKPVEANSKQLGGTAQTGRDIGASVLLSSGSGAGQLDITSGVVKSNLAQILGTALTETAGYLAAGFKKLFNIETPVLTMESVNQSADNNTILAHADYGNAKLARTGDDSDTLETLSDQIDFCNTTTPPTAAAIVNEWESQSQTDPTGFHVNVKEVNGTAQTANDNSADINTLITGVNVASEDNIDFGALKKASLNAATPASTGTVTGNVNGSVGSLTGHTVQTGDSYAIVNGDHGLVSIQDDIDALNNISVANIIAGIADGDYDLQEMIRIIFAACAGKSTGGGTTTNNFRDSADGKNRIAATVDANGNRTGMTLDGS